MKKACVSVGNTSFFFSPSNVVKKFRYALLLTLNLCLVSQIKQLLTKQIHFDKLISKLRFGVVFFH